MRQIDGIVFCIDNYGDIGIALSILLQQKEQGARIRLFCDAHKQAEKFLLPEQKHHIELLPFTQDFCDYASELFLFFDAQIPEALRGSNKKRTIIRKSYLQFDDQSRGLDGIRYFDTQYNAEITYEVLSLNTLKTPRILLGYSLPLDLHEYFGIFCYPESWPALEVFFSEIDTKTPLLIFGNGGMGISGSHRMIQYNGNATISIQPPQTQGRDCLHLPFVPLNIFITMLRQCKKAIVRGEHSLAIAHEFCIPHAWDIYTESNGMHKEKLRDYWSQTEFGDVSLQEVQKLLDARK